MKLTKKEQEIYSLLLHSFKNIEEIADEVGISCSTMKAHCRNIYDKLVVDNRQQLLVLEIDRLNNIVNNCNKVL